MKKDPYKIDPSRSPLLPNSGYRISGLFVAGLAAAIFVILGIVWSMQSDTGARSNAAPPPSASTTATAQ